MNNRITSDASFTDFHAETSVDDVPLIMLTDKQVDEVIEVTVSDCKRFSVVFEFQGKVYSVQEKSR